MARRRYISTAISLDKDVNRLAEECGDFAALLYTWMITHADDDSTITGDPEDIFYMVCPRRKDKTPDDVAAAIAGMVVAGLLWPYVLDGKPRLQFPPESFYRYQTYVPQQKRNYQDLRKVAGNAAQIPVPATITEERRETPKSSEEYRTSAQNAASPSPSPMPSPSPIPSSTTTPTPPKHQRTEQEEEQLHPAIDFWQRNIGVNFYMKPYELDVLVDYLRKGLPGDCLKRGLEIAVEAGGDKANIKYISGIFDRWIAAELFTLDAIRADEGSRRRSKARDSPDEGGVIVTRPIRAKGGPGD